MVNFFCRDDQAVKCLSCFGLKIKGPVLDSPCEGSASHHMEKKKANTFRVTDFDELVVVETDLDKLQHSIVDRSRIREALLFRQLNLDMEDLLQDIRSVFKVSDEEAVEYSPDCLGDTLFGKERVNQSRRFKSCVLDKPIKDLVF